MVSREIIDEIISKSILSVKCATSSRAKKRGSGGVEQQLEDGKGMSITYSDGTTLTFDENNDIKNITMDGVDYNYIGSDNVYNEFEYQTQELSSMKAKVNNFHNYNMRGGIMDNYDFETEYDFVKKFASTFASSFGIDLNMKLYAGQKLDKYKEDGGFLSSPMIITESDVHTKHFIDLEKQSRIDKNDIVLKTYVRHLHETDKLEKLSYTAKGFTSTSAGGKDENLKNLFGGSDESWTVYTVVKKNSNARGLFLGNALTDARSNRISVFEDWEAEVNIPPNTRFTRDLIDEDRHIIIQHIEKQRI